jgi:uncharacterized repeat protein (TIGR01451 family)
MRVRRLLPSPVRRIALAPAALVLLLSMATPAAAVQTFPDPFGGDGTHVDLRAGSTAQDIGDVFLLREGDNLQIEILLEPPNSFIESHVCLSADPFTGRVPPGQCQYQAQGAASGTYDITLPPSSFPSGTNPFTDPLDPFCAQIHVSYSAPGLARTAKGGGTAFGGWQPGQPFYGNICLPEAPEPPNPGDPAITVDKTGVLQAGDVRFTVTVANPTQVTAPDVTLVDTLPPGLSWSLPPGCTTGSGGAVTCDLGDMAGGASVDLLFVATPGVEDCGTFTNGAEGFIGAATDPADSDSASVEVPCQPDADDPLILITKTPTAISVALPGTVTYVITAENVGPGAAQDVQFTDELPAGATWTIGSGSNVCSISGSTLSCFAPDVPDGVFEVVEVFGTLDGSVCVMDNSASISWTGGPDPGLAVADAAQVQVTGCEATGPTAAANPTDGVGSGGVPNTAAPSPERIPLSAVAVALLLASALATALALGLPKLEGRP